MEWIIWIPAYGALWALTVLWSAVTSPQITGNPGFEKVRDGVLAALSLLAGMAAVGLVVIGIEADLGVFIILVFAFGAGVVAVSSLIIGQSRKAAAGSRERAMAGDAGGLEKPAWLDPGNEQKEMKRVATISDQYRLLQVAVFSSHVRVRKAALAKIRDDNVLLAAITAAASGDLSKADCLIMNEAADKIRDQEVLANIALHVGGKNTSLKDLYVTVMRKITDQKLLAGIARQSSALDSRLEAVARLEDMDAIISLAQSDRNYHVRYATVKKVDDSAVLAAIAKTDQKDFVRHAALIKVTDQALLADILANAQDSHIRAEAAGGIDDRSVLTAALKKEKDGTVRAKICLKLGGHAMRQCRCSRCGMEVHEYALLRREEERISAIAAIETRYYACAKCGKTKEERGGGGID